MKTRTKAEVQADRAATARRKGNEARALEIEAERPNRTLNRLGKRGRRLKAADDKAAAECKQDLEHCELGGWKFACTWNDGYLEAHHLRTRPQLNNEERHSPKMLAGICSAHHEYANTHGKEVRAEVERRRAIADARGESL